jgi:hypothetical protein
VAALVVVVLAVAFAGDRLLRDHESRALRDCVLEAESDLDDLSYRTAGIEVYIASTVYRPDIPASLRDSLKGLVEETVLRGLPPLQRDQVRCESVRAWHRRAKTGREDYLAYFDLRMQQLSRAVEDIHALHVEVVGLADARARARAALAPLGVRLSP